MSIIRHPAGSAAAAPSVLIFGYGPSNLRRAYKLVAASARDGRGRTVAIVDAFSDPMAAANLATYRRHYRLGACTEASGCLRIIDQHGRRSPLPRPDISWAQEESLDLDMVSAICPRCHILLVEAHSNSTADLGAAEDTAVAKGARYVSNSWSGGEFLGEGSANHFFNHPGVAISFAAGDFGYGAAYPADTQYVTAVGGTTLRHSRTTRGWTESVWGSNTPAGEPGTGSGCSTLEAKPSWQRADDTSPGGCLNRTGNDVAAIADPNTGVAVYDTYLSGGSWLEFGGTSVATPIITSVYALAGIPARGSYPAEYPYLHHKHLFNVPTGSNGSCESVRRYLCHGGRGYNGPTGLGTPAGTAAFASGRAHLVTLVDPGTRDVAAGRVFSLRIRGLDTRSGARSLSYRAAGLPAGLSIASVRHSTNGKITGTASGMAGIFQVTVTAKDGGATGTTRFTIVTVASMAAASPVFGPVTLNGGAQCLDDNGGASGRAVRIESCGDPAAQNWAYQSSGPDGVGELTIGGRCLGLSGRDGLLAACDGAAGQQWAYRGFGELESPASGRCLAVPSLRAGTRVDVAACATGNGDQTWNLPEGPIITGAGASCLENPGDSQNSGTRAKVASCVSAESGQQWFPGDDGTIESDSGLCLDANGSDLDGTHVVLNICDTTNASQIWLAGPGGEFINASSGRCLADPGNGGPGTGLVQQDCYGQPGEIWAVS